MEDKNVDIFSPDEIGESHGEYALRMGKLVEQIQQDLDVMGARIETAPEFNEILSLRNQIKTLKSDHAFALQSQKKSYEIQIAEINKQHQLLLSETKTTLNQKHMTEISDMLNRMNQSSQEDKTRIQEYEIENTRIKDENNKILDKLRAQHTREHKKYIENLDNIRKEHSTAMANLQENHSTHLKTIEDKYATEKKEYFDNMKCKVDKIRSTCAEQIEKIQIDSEIHARNTHSEHSAAIQLLDEKRVERIRLLSESLKLATDEVTECKKNITNYEDKVALQSNRIVSLEKQLIDQDDSSKSIILSLQEENGRLQEKLLIRQQSNDLARRDWTLAETISHRLF